MWYSILNKFILVTCQLNLYYITIVVIKNVFVPINYDIRYNYHQKPSVNIQYYCDYRNLNIKIL